MTITPEADLGTPASTNPDTVTLTIDGQELRVPRGTSILRAALAAGIDVPRLCATDSLAAFGSCRLCVVEVEGGKGTPASCTTLCADDLVVATQTLELQELRRNVLDLYLSEHPADCAGCSRGNCELAGLAQRLGASARYGRPAAELSTSEVDASNPYFRFDPAACIVCSRCVRACNEIQGSFALTMTGRGAQSEIATGGASFLDSECVSCGACVQACPTDALTEHALVDLGMPQRSVVTTCAYCGVGCSLSAEVIGEGAATQVVRMVPSNQGAANEGHSCVKGRFAYGYAAHPDRQLRPMIRESIDDPWRQVSWDEAITTAAASLRDIQARFGVGAIGGISSSRCTNEEVYVVQKLVRAAFGNNNVDTCARVCHSPTGYGLGQAFGTSAGTQDFKSVEAADVILLVGANPTDAHPVFGSRLKRRLRAGAQIIVADPRAIDLVRSAHVEAAYHLRVRPGTNVAFVNAMAHVIVTEGLADTAFVANRCEDPDDFLSFIAGSEHSPESTASITGIEPEALRAAARLYAAGPNSAIYYGLGVTEHSQGSTMVMGLANLAMLTGNLGREGVGVNPLRGQNNVQGSCDMGSFPHEFPGYRHVSDDSVRAIYEDLWDLQLDPEPGLRIPNMFDSALGGSFKGLYIQGEDIAQSDPNTAHVEAALRSMDCVIVQDLFLNETARFAHVFLPGTSFLEKDGTFTNAERRLGRVRPVMPPLTGKDEWQVTCELATAMGYPMGYTDASQIMAEIAATTPTFAGVSFDRLDSEGSMQWPVNDAAPHGTPTMHVGGFVRGLGKLNRTVYVPSDERTSARYPLVLTTGRILTQYNVGAQTRRTGNQQWHPEDILEIHPSDAELRGIHDRDRVEIRSRVGATHLTARHSDRMPPGVVYTTFHHPVTGANVVTTEHSDWATNCPEYKVTAVEVTVANAGNAPAHVAAGQAAHPPEEARPVTARLAADIVRRVSTSDDPVQAAARHIRTFWPPHMRHDFATWVAGAGPGTEPFTELARQLLELAPLRAPKGSGGHDH